MQRCSLEQAGHLSKAGIQAISNQVRPWCSTLAEPVTREIAHYKLLVRYIFGSAPRLGWAAGQMHHSKGHFKIVTLPGITVANEAAARAAALGSLMLSTALQEAPGLASELPQG